MIYSDDQRFCIIPGSSEVHQVNPQPMKVSRQFGLHFTAQETHFLTEYSERTSLPPDEDQEPKIGDDKEALKILNECMEDIDNLLDEIEDLEDAMNMD